MSKKIEDFQYVECNWKKFFKLLKVSLTTNPSDSPFPTFFIVGDTGIGKNTNIYSFARTFGIPLATVNLGGAEPSDIQGMPYKDENNLTRWTLPYWFKDADKAEKGLASADLEKIFKDVPKEQFPDRIVFLDEFNRVPPDTFAPMMNFILEHTLHGQKMTGRPLVIAAGNVSTTDADNFVVHEFDRAQKQRLRMVSIRPDFDEWEKYATSVKVDPTVIGFFKKQRKAVKVWNKEGAGGVDLRSITEMGIRTNAMSKADLDEIGDVFVKSWMPIEIAEPLLTEMRMKYQTLTADKVFTNYASVKQEVLTDVAKRKHDGINHICKEISTKLSEFGAALKEVKGKGLPKEDLAKELKALEGIRYPIYDNMYQFLLDIPKEMCVATMRNITSSTTNEVSFEFTDRAPDNLSDIINNLA